MHLNKLIAHRGASKYAPENTLIALRKAAELGARWVEFDVQLSQDHHAIVFHDHTLERTTNGQGFVASKTLKELQSLDAGTFFDKKFRHETIPTLDEWVQVASSLGVSLNIELKPADPSQHEVLIERVLLAVELFWNHSLDEIIVSSFDRECLSKFHAAAPEFPIACLYDEYFEDWYDWAQTMQAVTVNFPADQLLDEQIARIQEKGIPLYLFTVNDADRAAHYFELGVSGVFSDDTLLLNARS